MFLKSNIGLYHDLIELLIYYSWDKESDLLPEIRNTGDILLSTDFEFEIENINLNQSFSFVENDLNNINSPLLRFYFLFASCVSFFIFYWTLKENNKVLFVF